MSGQGRRDRAGGASRERPKGGSEEERRCGFGGSRRPFRFGFTRSWCGQGARDEGEFRADGELKACERVLVLIDRGVQGLFGPRCGGLGLDQLGGRGVSSRDSARNQAEVLPGLLEDGPGRFDPARSHPRPRETQRSLHRRSRRKSAWPAPRLHGPRLRPPGADPGVGLPRRAPGSERSRQPRRWRSELRSRLTFE